MFSLVSGIYESYWASPQINLLVVGAQGVGKTTLLERIKVTQFHKKPAAPTSQPPPLSTSSSQGIKQQEPQYDGIDDLLVQAFLSGKLEERNDVQSPKVASSPIDAAANSTVNVKKRFAWACPAPRRYANAATTEMDDDDEEQEIDQPKMIGQEKAEERTGSMESIDLAREPNPSPSGGGETTKRTAQNAASFREFDVKTSGGSAAVKMISLHRIRPTIGMNLGKVELCGAKCHFWDLGGRLQDLWERYYLDCDAVVFVWKIPDDVNHSNTASGAAPDDDDDEIPEITPQLQQSLLEKVRNAIPDDVPFLVLGHVFDNSAKNCLASIQKGTQPHPEYQPPQMMSSSSSSSSPQHEHLEMDKLYDTNSLLPHYHNPHQAVCLASAITGQGVQFAMEWLIPLAKRQHRIRDQQQRSSSSAALQIDVPVTGGSAKHL
jgi:GTPase SAR1 family protein